MSELNFLKMKADFSTCLQDAIRKSAREASMEPLQAIFAAYSTSSDGEKRHALDHAFREKLSSILSNPNNSNISIFENLVRLSIMTSKKDMCNATLPVVLLSDTFESLTLDNCDKLFNFVEESVSIWKEDFFFSSGKNHILRMCNDLLRRLSRSQNTVFCGRILLFLAKFFPFSERSGLNIVSEFNLENVTEYNAKSEDDSIKMETSIHNEDATKNKLKIDYNLYCKFWALQDFFRNPNQCYNKIQWKTFILHSADVLDAFSSYKLEEIGVGETKKEKHVADQQYFAKYLTSQKLLELQLSDTNFRRFVLLQFLILFQYLTSTVKFRSDNDELKTDQAEWVKETTVSIYALLVETPPHGADFAKAVKHILERESHWSAWKNDGCHEFKKPASSNSPSEPLKKRPVKRLGDQMRAAIENKRVLMGNPELTKLWNQASNNLEACRTKDRDFLPSLETYFEEAISQANPATMVEEKYKKVNDGNFGWRALRLMARRSPHFFTHSNTQISKLPEYLEMMIKKIAKDLPSGETADDLKVEETDLGGPSQDAEEDELLEEPKDGFKETKETVEAKVEQVDDYDDDPEERTTIALTQELLDSVAKVIAAEWIKVATKLGYKEDEIEYLKGQYDNDIDKCIHLLKIWKQDDEDASAAGLAYTLTGLGLTDAAVLLQ
ncbi:THO complex subunit 1 [Neocloeon triangulifer]|uniref:THO complex subunit 1 n=1 Tax=Neocloeon triangulifer TaxID=2078957 RepID=UPI00286F776D|nr:THO complex subunit 1 [Neocloeon triangulifer]